MPSHAAAPFFVISLASAVALVACQHASEPASKLAAPAVPDSLRPPDGEVLVAKVLAKGTQNYECRTTDNTTYAWKLVGPDADLSDETGKSVGHHYVGPTWESTDGSKVVGEVKAKADAPDGQGIPWLLLKATSTSGTGVFSKVTSIQRVDTTAGLAPSTGCDAQHVGARQNIAYRGTYYFYSAR
jgi:Protein of unknown function (DUF3455)